jgi:Tol biopolymer transport system component
MWPVWSPDGSQIDFLSNFLSGKPLDTEIFVMDVDVSDVHQITPRTGFEWGLD